jgi:hypothetical protein
MFVVCDVDVSRLLSTGQIVLWCTRLRSDARRVKARLHKSALRWQMRHVIILNLLLKLFLNIIVNKDHDLNL